MSKTSGMRRVFWIEAEPWWCWPFLFLLLPLPRAAAQLRLADTSGGHPVQLPWTCWQSCSCCSPGGTQRWLCVSLAARTRSCFMVCQVPASCARLLSSWSVPSVCLCLELCLPRCRAFAYWTLWVSCLIIPSARWDLRAVSQLSNLSATPPTCVISTNQHGSALWYCTH